MVSVVFFAHAMSAIPTDGQAKELAVCRTRRGRWDFEGSGHVVRKVEQWQTVIGRFERKMQVRIGVIMSAERCDGRMWCVSDARGGVVPMRRVADSEPRVDTPTPHSVTTKEVY